ncbi:hypothetical protein Bbelb_264650 [Branchiostoma belcheri]|nr:hypothetical protein Bbelb_264650 [Branchiostoma belcheri]
MPPAFPTLYQFLRLRNFWRVEEENWGDRPPAIAYFISPARKTVQNETAMNRLTVWNADIGQPKIYAVGRGSFGKTSRPVPSIFLRGTSHSVSPAGCPARVFDKRCGGAAMACGDSPERLHLMG